MFRNFTRESQIQAIMRISREIDRLTIAHENYMAELEETRLAKLG